MFDDISFLVQETLNEAAKYSQSEFQQEVPDDCCGVIFNVEKNDSTFVIRIKTCVDLANDYNLAKTNSDEFSQLRLSEESKLSYFACDDIQIAELIRERFANKRFPKFEENVLNVSDPGDSWWMDISCNKIKVNLKLSQTNDINQLIKLGPLGDAEDSAKVFSVLGGYFQMLFPLKDFSSHSNQLEISAEDEGHPAFSGLKNLFLNGDATFEFWEELRLLESKYEGSQFSDSLKQANHFLMELSQLRSFWIDVQTQIDKVN